MRMSRILVLAMALGAMSARPSFADHLAGQCDVRAKGPDGALAVVYDAAAIDAAISRTPERALALPKGYSGGFIDCDRNSLIPEPNDFKVLNLDMVLHIRETATSRGL